jgi:hypothetical protein
MSDVAKQSSAVAEMQSDWELARALLGGTKAMRAAGEKYLTKWPNEDAEAYKCRLASAVLFPAYSRTVQTLAGKPFSKPLTIGDDTPPQIVEWMADADQQGRNLHSFAADIMEMALGYGFGGILTEYPRAEGVRTVADERAAGLRPYLVQIFPWQVLGWKVRRINGKEVLMQLRLLESVTEDDGDFGEKNIEQVRVLIPGAWATYRSNDKGVWALHDQGITSISFIPFVPVYGHRTGFMTGKPPLIELAHMNVKHWNSQSDQDTILHVARVPILFLKCFPDTFTLTVGGGAAIKADSPEADGKFIEHTGAAIEAGKVSLDDLKEEMRQAGAELLVIKPGTVTATQHSNENAVGMCALQRITNDLKDALDLALQYCAEWVGLPDGGSVTLFTDFGSATLAEASAELLLKVTQAGKMSDESLHTELQRRGIRSPDVDWPTEKERIEAQGPALGTLTNGDD